MFASALGVFVALGLVMLIGTFIMIGTLASVGSQPEFIPKPNTVFKLSLNGPISDNVEDNPFDMLMGTIKPLSQKDILKAIKTAKENDHIQGIYLELGMAFYTGTASIDPIRRALIEFKESGKFIVAYADSYSQGGYHLCSVADKVFLNPEGTLSISGLLSETMFVKGLYKKVGIDWLIFRVGTYKGAVESYMLDKLSDENREQITAYQQTVWKNITYDISEARNIQVADINQYADEGLFFSKGDVAVERGFIDELKYKPEVEDYVKELAGQTGDKLKTAGLDKIKNIRDRTKKKADQIAILYAEGIINFESTSPSMYSSDPVITQKVADELIKLRKNDEVKAVVFRVNSRGGSAYVSDQIWREVVELKKVKPIVVSMGSYAASGGYYISCAANMIVAEPNTLTGSIGIFGRFPNATDLFKKLDLTMEYVKTNKYGDMLDPSRPMREDEKALIQSFVNKGYDTFISRCADGRGMTKEEIDKIGQGRVWTGEQALEIGLVDALGGIDNAVRIAAELAELSDYSIVNVSGSKDFFKELLEKQLDDLKVSIVKEQLGPGYKYFKEYKEMESLSGILALYPYEVF